MRRALSWIAFGVSAACFGAAFPYAAVGDRGRAFGLMVGFLAALTLAALLAPRDGMPGR